MVWDSSFTKWLGLYVKVGIVTKIDLAHGLQDK